MSVLPDPAVYQYLSHLYHADVEIPFDQYQPLPDWTYPSHDFQRFTRMFDTDNSYWYNQRVLDLGCHSGFISLCALHHGAADVHGINVRSRPIDIANYAFAQLQAQDWHFTVGDVEDRDMLAQACQGRDTAVLALILEMIRNPYQVLETITRSDISQLVIESAVFSRDSTAPMLRYYRQPTDSAFSTWQQDLPVAMGAIPNTTWLESVLYDLGWEIQHYSVTWEFSRNWFAQPGLHSLPPKTCDVAFIMARKFSSSVDKQF